MAPGSHTLAIATVDSDAVEYAAVASFAVLRPDPVVSAISGGPGSATDTSASFTWWTTDVDTSDCTTDIRPAFACLPPITLGGFGVGDHWFRVNGYQVDTGKVASSTTSWNVAPAFASVPADPTVGDVNGNVDVEFSWSAPGAYMPMTCALDGRAFACNEWVPLSVGPGLHTFQLMAQSSTNGTWGTNSYTWRVTKCQRRVRGGAVPC